jgi:hypothetical protein
MAKDGDYGGEDCFERFEHRQDLPAMFRELSPEGDCF